MIKEGASTTLKRPDITTLGKNSGQHELEKRSTREDSSRATHFRWCIFIKNILT